MSSAEGVVLRLNGNRGRRPCDFFGKCAMTFYATGPDAVKGLISEVRLLV